MAEIARARALIQARTNIAQEVKVRSERLKQIARYRRRVRVIRRLLLSRLGFSEGDVLGGGDAWGAERCADA